MTGPWRVPRSRAILLGAGAAVVLAAPGALLVVRGLAGARGAGAPSVVTTATAATESTARPSASVVDEGAPALRGRILDATGEPVPGAAVHLITAAPPWRVLLATTSDAAGSFTVAHPGALRLRVDADRDPQGAVRSAELRCAEGATATVTLVLSPAAIRGVVVDASERPIAGATLSVEGVPWAVPGASSDASGAFQLRAVPFEASAVVAVASGYRTSRVAVGPREDAPEPRLRVQLQAAPPAEGDVLDPDGKPVRARVVACEGGAAEARVSSEEDGTFRLPPSAIGCRAIALHDELGPSEATPVLEGKRTVLRLRAGGGIEGVVVDVRGAAVPAFSVGVESYAGAHGQSARGMPSRSFQGGAFQWSGLAPGSYVLTAGADGSPPTRSTAVDVQAGAVTRGVRIVLAPGGTVAGHVYDDRRSPVAGVRLALDGTSATLESAASAITDDAGAYRLEGAAPAGLFTLVAQKPGYRARYLSGLRVASGATLPQDLVLTPIDGGAGFELGGIGAGLSVRDGAIVLASVFPGDPADRAGLRPGDRVASIDGDDTAGMSIADALQRLRGEPGTSVGVTVHHEDATDALDVVIVRARIAH